MGRITYKTALQWIIDNDDIEWIKDEKPEASVIVNFVSEMYRVDVPKIIRTLRRDMGLDKVEESKPEKVAKPKAEKPVKAKPVKKAKPTKAERQAKLKKVEPETVAESVPEAPQEATEVPSETATVETEPLPNEAEKPTSEVITTDDVDFVPLAFLTKNKE